MSVVKIALLATLLTLATVAFYSRNHTEIQEFSSQDPLFSEFKAWKVEQGKSYGGAEEAKRFTIYKANKAFVAEHEATNPNRTYTLGTTQFSDLTNEEFAAIYLGLKKTENTLKATVEAVEGGENPASVDWRNKAVNPVKNQGQCGSCWAFSTVAALEGLQAQKTGKLVVLSEQQIVDCSKENAGCNGGDMPPALRYVSKNGVQLDSDYPYKGVDGKCKFDSKKVAFQNKGTVEVKANDWKALETAASKQVIAVSVNAAGFIQHYKNGIINSLECGTALDHGVALVGYTPEAWIIRNSWGPSFGENGYFRVAKGDQAKGRGYCGINMENSYPTL